METARKIDLDRFIQSGEGANGQSYDSLDDDSVMLKLYNPDYDLTAILTEHEVARRVYALGVPSPEPGEIVTDGTRTGMLFRRIVGKRSFSRAIADEPERTEEYAAEFARYCKRLHSLELPTGSFPDAKKDFLRLLDAASYLNEEAVYLIGKFITDRVPDCTTALHGDMHVGNVLTTLPKGHPLAENHEIYFIDLGYFSIGCPLLDIGMLDNICNYSDDSFLEHDFHFGRETAHRLWKAFVREYFFGPEKLGEKWFGPGATPEDAAGGMIPYTIVKLLLVGYNIGFLPEGYLDFIYSNLDSLRS